MAKKNQLSAIIRYAGFEYLKDGNVYHLRCKDTHEEFTAKYWLYQDEMCLSIEHSFDFNAKNQKRLYNMINHIKRNVPSIIISIEDLREPIDLTDIDISDIELIDCTEGGYDEFEIKD